MVVVLVGWDDLKVEWSGLFIGEMGGGVDSRKWGESSRKHGLHGLEARNPWDGVCFWDKSVVSRR